MIKFYTSPALRFPFLLLLLANLLIFNQSSSAQAFVWVKSYGGVQKDKGKDLSVDQFGNQYLTGLFQNELTMGSTVLHAVGGATDQDIFVSKTDIDGNAVWGHSFGSGINLSDDLAFGLNTNDNGFSAVTGKCFGYVKMDNGDSLSGSGLEDMWLVTYDPDGNLNWAKIGGGVSDDVGSAVYVDNDQNVYCTGNFEGDMNFYGDSMMSVPNGKSMFCAKYNWGGELLWVYTFSSSGGVQVHDILVDPSGNIYMSGNYKHTVSFGDYEFTSLGDNDGYIVKMTPAGEVLWATTFGSDIPYSDEAGATISLDDAGNCYVAGVFAGNCIFNGGQLTTNSLKNVLVAAYDIDGNFLWANAIKGGAGAKFSPVTLSISVEENILVSGMFTGVDTIGSVVLEPYTNTDSADAFIASLNLMGDVNWAIHVGGDGNDGAFGIAGNGSAFAFATGNYREAAQFGPNNLLSNGVSDIWIAKFQKNTVTASSTYIPTVQTFQTYPNPFREQLTIDIPMKTTDLIVYNQFGQVVYRRTISSGERQINLDLSVPAAGIYTVQLKGEYGVHTGLIEKQSY
ncbi:MAG: T9SS type A sorting domain-containing protein [Chitinophagales bacterium]